MGLYKRSEVSATVSLLQVFNTRHRNDSMNQLTQDRALKIKIVPPRRCLPTHALQQEGETPSDIFLTLDLLPGVFKPPVLHRHAVLSQPELKNQVPLARLQFG